MPQPWVRHYPRGFARSVIMILWFTPNYFLSGRSSGCIHEHHMFTTARAEPFHACSLLRRESFKATDYPFTKKEFSLFSRVFQENTPLELRELNALFSV